MAGHSFTCEFYKYKEEKTGSSRPKLFDATSVLWMKNKKRNFVTFTLPSLQNGTYQRDVDCPETGDLIVSSKFSKVLEAWSVRTKRLGNDFSYTWVSEAQKKRQEKFGGIGDIHFHLVVNQQLKNNSNRFTDKKTFDWLQNLWCEHVGVSANNCVHVDPLPEGIKSMPSYLSKYLGKGTQRQILARQFAATRDLTRFKPISIHSLPEIEPIHIQDIKAANGYEVTSYYFPTTDILETYGALMLDESRFNASRTDKNFTHTAIINRAIHRQRVSTGFI